MSSSLTVALNDNKPRISLRKADLIAQKLAHSKTGVETTKIETALTRTYARIFINLIRESTNYPTNIQSIRLQYEQLVYDVSRTAIQLTYQLGVEYVAKNEQTDPYLTHEDINTIETLTDETVESFWRKVSVDANRKIENSQLKAANQPLKPDLKIISFLELASVNAMSAALSRATISKLQQLKLSRNLFQINPPPTNIKTASSTKTTLEESDIEDKDDDEDKIESTILAQLNLQKAGILHSALLLGTIMEQARAKGITNTKGALQAKRLIVWITRKDERVCPQCAPLHGRVFEVDDPFLPSPGVMGPGMPTHNRCRCRTLEIMVDGSIPT
jgi:SPP1 gp7 family putative phage head morphogenesis protein